MGEAGALWSVSTKLSSCLDHSARRREVVEVTREEVAKHLHWLMWHLDDKGYTMTACQVEDAYMRVATLKWPSALCCEYAACLLPSGRRGRVHLVFCHPYEARGLLLCVGLLHSVEDDPSPVPLQAQIAPVTVTVSS